MMRAICIAILAAACGSSSAAPDPAPSVHAWKPQHGSAMVLARRTMENLLHDPSGPRPDWVLYDPSGDQVVFVGVEPGYRRALAIAQSYDLAPPPAPPPAPPDPDPTPIAGITQVDDTDFVVERAAVDKILADPMTVAKGARIVPSIKSGVPDGLKLYAIRPSSAYAQLGLQNGDTIHAVNGHDISSADKALEAYQQLRDARSVDLSITRRGKDFVLHYSIK
jgi:hypothetical protein